MIDYFSEEILVDNLVEPDVPMRHLNTRFSGVSWADFKNARKTGTCLSGKAGARLAIWKYVGTDTIVIGHGVSNDLRALRWIHTSVVDSLLLESGRLKSKIMEEGKNELPKQENLQNLAACSVGLEECAEKRVHVRRPGGNSLKTLAKKYLNRDIQLNGKRGHDSLEDAIAARDLVHRSTVCFDGDM
ncbi:hypothetical protein N0V94_009561 [Neodidymelliopsis sp. IMI 364377]|nr:hypothetical protein N0V94_009561 [Neodidymelliopsis sp. IMI 364377]